MEELQVQLRRFHTELADVEIRADMQVQVDGFLRFADFFFDGIFADWAVMNRIHDAQQQVEGTRDQISRVLTRRRRWNRTPGGNWRRSEKSGSA